MGSAAGDGTHSRLRLTHPAAAAHQSSTRGGFSCSRPRIRQQKPDTLRDPGYHAMIGRSIEIATPV